MRVLKGKFLSSVFHSCKAKNAKTRILVTGPQCVKREHGNDNKEVYVVDVVPSSAGHNLILSIELTKVKVTVRINLKWSNLDCPSCHLFVRHT
jgi:hypothetical protein